MTLLADHNLLITASFDGTAHVCDAVVGTPFLTLHNPRRAVYAGLTWLGAAQELVLADTAGWLYVWDIFSEKMKKQMPLAGGAGGGGGGGGGAGRGAGGGRGAGALAGRAPGSSARARRPTRGARGRAPVRTWYERSSRSISRALRPRSAMSPLKR